MSIIINKTEQENHLIFLIKFGIKAYIYYCAYFFLTISVCLLLVVVLIILITISQDNLSFAFLKYLTFIVPKFKEEFFNIETKGIMYIYFVFSLALMLFSNIIRLILKKVLNREINITLRQKTMFAFIFIHLVYIIIFLAVPYIKIAEGTDRVGLYPAFLICYLVNILSTAIYILLSYLSEKILSAN